MEEEEDNLQRDIPCLAGTFSSSFESLICMICLPGISDIHADHPYVIIIDKQTLFKV